MEKTKIVRNVYNIMILCCLVVGTAYVVLQFCHFGRVEFTDNARVRQHITPQCTRVQGFIREIRFDEFQYVHKGDTLAIIEDAEYRLQLLQAEAGLASAEHGAKASGINIQTTEKSIEVTQANIEEARVNYEYAQKEDQRYAELLKKDAVTPQQYDNVHTAYLAANARYEQAKRSQSVQTNTKAGQEHYLSESEQAVKLAKAAVDLARLNLSYCYIIATCDGVTGTKDINEGQLVNPGQTIVSIVDANDMWVEANYKESQLHNIAIGAKVKITADAVPGEEYEGIVESCSDATGSAFSLIPIDNATGNFVKVEQRVTIRISLKGNDAEKLGKLHAGYNVECEVKY